MNKVINLPMLAHPINWLIVWIVLAFAGFAWALIHEATASSITPATPQQQAA